LLARGKVREIYYSEANNKIFESFLKKTIHTDKPKLENLFLDKFSSETRLFIFEFAPNNWEGAILVSQNSRTKIQGEQFYRVREGKNGIMDTLVYELSNIFYNEGFLEFSLGEVPFLINSKFRNSWKTKFINIAGNRIKYAYNYQSLHYFKDKFATSWNNIYVCSNKRFLLWDLLGVAKKSNLLNLAIFKMFN
jgi:hypothetical protein